MAVTLWEVFVSHTPASYQASFGQHSMGSHDVLGLFVYKQMRPYPQSIYLCRAVTYRGFKLFLILNLENFSELLLKQVYKFKIKPG